MTTIADYRTLILWQQSWKNHFYWKPLGLVYRTLWYVYRTIHLSVYSCKFHEMILFHLCIFTFFHFFKSLKSLKSLLFLTYDLITIPFQLWSPSLKSKRWFENPQHHDKRIVFLIKHFSNCYILHRNALAARALCLEPRLKSIKSLWRVEFF